MAFQDEIRERVTNEIIDALQRGVAPWHQPWSASANTGFPCNAISKRRYSGVNPLLLQLSALERGFQSKWWGTFNQWQALGAQVQKRPSDVPPGHWGTKIIFFKPITTVARKANGDEEERTFPLLREYTVFNADQVEGAEQFKVRHTVVPTPPDYLPAERVIEATGADTRHGGEKACYFYPPNDYIMLPHKCYFLAGIGGLMGYYDTAFHELCHWSEPRLGWKGSYAVNELRAEVGAAYLSAEIGIPSNGPGNHHASYLDSWIRGINEDHRAIFRIASAASAAADYILSFSRAEQPQDAGAEAVPA